MSKQATDPTDDELDEWERLLTVEPHKSDREIILDAHKMIDTIRPLIKALRACRQRTKAKDEVVEAAERSRNEARMALCSDQLKTKEQTDAEAALNNIEAWLSEPLAALDKETGDASGG